LSVHLAMHVRRHRSTLPVTLCAASLLALGCVDAVSPTADRSPGGIYDQLWAEYDRHYAFFASRRVDWAGVRARHRPGALAGGPALFNALCATIDTLHDYHAVLFTEYGVCGSPPLRRTYAFDPSAADRYLGATARKTPSGIIAYGAIADVAYLRVSRFDGAQQVAEIDQLLAGFVDGSRLIIDLRANVGGNSATGDAIAGRFADLDRPYAVVRFRSGPGHDDFGVPTELRLRPAGPRRFGGRIALIVDRSVGSAGEDFTMAMRVLPAVTVVGDTTSGSASNPLWRELPNGWSYWVPQSIETTIDGITPTVDGGIPPAVFARTSAADSARGSDTLLDSAIAVLRR